MITVLTVLTALLLVSSLILLNMLVLTSLFRVADELLFTIRLNKERRKGRRQ